MKDYKVVSPMSISAKGIEDTLKDYAKDGWELITMTPSYKLIFERELVGEAALGHTLKLQGRVLNREPWKHEIVEDAISRSDPLGPVDPTGTPAHGLLRRGRVPTNLNEPTG